MKEVFLAFWVAIHRIELLNQHSGQFAGPTFEGFDFFDESQNNFTTLKLSYLLVNCNCKLA